MISNCDVVIIGAGAAGLMCAIESGKRGRNVRVIDHARTIGEKIRISGGGRCNFTNIHTNPRHFLSQNTHFCKSALSRYTPRDFIALVEKHGIAYHEKKLGQLFCDVSARSIINMLLSECQAANVAIQNNTAIQNIEKSSAGGYDIFTGNEVLHCQSLVIATGGLSIPKIGASGFGYELAKKFDLKIIATRPALVPLTFQDNLLQYCKNFSGLSVEAHVSCHGTDFAEGLLFTHKGLSGPSILQISSYWKDGDAITINLLPDNNLRELLQKARTENARKTIDNVIAFFLPQRLADAICDYHGCNGQMANLSLEKINILADAVHNWKIFPAGTEGYRTAEVTLGGVDTNELSSRTFEAKKHSGLYFIGEVVDVTGHLGGFNFQWAWSSGYCAGQYV